MKNVMRFGRIRIRYYKGATLTELLVVVTVIGLLVAILFPVTHSILQTSRAAACVSNLHTLGNALQTYIAENNGRFPPSRNRAGNDGNGNAVGQDHWIYSAYYGGAATASSEGLKPIQYFPGPEPNGGEMRKPGKQYKDAGIFWCPADNKPALRPMMFAASSYTGNEYYIGGETAFFTNAVTGKPKEEPSDYKPSRSRLLAVPRPSEILYAIDHVDLNHVMFQSPISAATWPLTPGSSKDPSGHSIRVAFDRHAGKANALFLDGSVRALAFTDLVGTSVKYLDPALQQ